MLGWSNNAMGGGGWVMMALIMVTFWSLVILAVAAIFRSTRNDASPHTTARRDPMEILDERFARGEIDSEEYQTRRAGLRRVS